MNHLLLSINVVFHPFIAFRVLKERNDSSLYIQPVIFIFLIMIIRIITVYFTHYPLATVNPINTNILLEAVWMIVPLLTWSVAAFAITSIMDGQTHFKTQLAATFYGMVPYIIMNIPIVILSHYMGGTDISLFMKIQAAMWIWIGILFFLSIKTMNGYSFRQTIGVCILIIITCVLIWIVLLLFFVLVEQVFTFLIDLAREIRLNFFY